MTTDRVQDTYTYYHYIFKSPASQDQSADTGQQQTPPKSGHSFATRKMQVVQRVGTHNKMQMMRRIDWAWVLGSRTILWVRREVGNQARMYWRRVEIKSHIAQASWQKQYSIHPPGIYLLYTGAAGRIHNQLVHESIDP